MSQHTDTCILVADRPRAVVQVGHGVGETTTYTMTPSQAANVPVPGHLRYQIEREGEALHRVDIPLGANFEHVLDKLVKDRVAFGAGVIRTTVETASTAWVRPLLKDEDEVA